MILPDTSIWIEFFKLHPEVQPALKREIDRQGAVAVECVFGELFQGAKGARERTILKEYWANLPKRDESGLWVEAGLRSGREKRFAKGVGLIDAFLIAFAEKYRLKIWTLDKKLAAALPAAFRYNSTRPPATTPPP
jgi:predicted nucleic acid-binding protein